MKPLLVTAAVLAAIAMTGAAEAPRAPQPAKPVDLAQLYSGRWHEIARLPEKLTDGCVAGWTDYRVRGPAQVEETDGCNMGTPEGKEKTIAGPGRILAPGVNAKLKVSYRFLGFIPVVRDYWILDHAEDYSWYISADPSFDKLWIFTRNPQIPATERNALVQRARALGYDVGRLEFPAQPAA